MFKLHIQEHLHEVMSFRLQIYFTVCQNTNQLIIYQLFTPTEKLSY